MIKIYYQTSCSSSKKLFAWVKQYNIEADLKRVRAIHKKDLIHLLSQTDEGIREVVKHKNHTNEEISQKLEHLNSLTFDEAIDFLLENTELLRTPIILSKNNYMIGYHYENIREFIPPGWRKRIYYN